MLGQLLEHGKRSDWLVERIAMILGEDDDQW